MRSTDNLIVAFKEYYKNRKSKSVLRRLRKIEIEISNIKSKVNRMYYGNKNRRQINDQ